MTSIPTRFIALIVVAFLFVGCARQHPVFRASNVENKQGVYYSLPATNLIVNIPVARVDSIPGSLRNYAAAYFSYDVASTRVLARSTVYKINAVDTTISTTTYADKDETFVAQVTAGPLQRRALDIKLNELGLFTDATSEFQDKTIEVALETIKVIATVAGVSLPPLPAPPAFAAAAGPPPPPTTPGGEKEAKEAYKRITDARTRRQNLLNSIPNGTNVEYLQGLLAELDKIEQSNLEKFLGSTKITPWIAQFEVDPGTRTAPLASLDLLHLSSTGQKLQPDSLQPLKAPPGDWFTTIPAGTAKKTVTIDLAQMPSPSTTVAAKYTKEPKRNGYFYRIPAQAMATVKFDNAVQMQNKLNIAQYGMVVALPVSTGSLLESKYTLSLHPETGTLKQVVSGSEPITAANITAAGESATAVVEYQNKVRALHDAERQAQEARMNEIVRRLVEAVKTE